MPQVLFVSPDMSAVNGSSDAVLKVPNAHGALEVFDKQKERIRLVIIDSRIRWWGIKQEQRGCARLAEHLRRPLNRPLENQTIQVVVICSERCGLCGYSSVEKEKVSELISSVLEKS